MELIRQLDPEKHLILLRLYGAKAQQVLKEVSAFETVVLLDYIAPAEMQYVDICVASLLPAWNHVCVPSKVVSAICWGIPVLYNANKESEGACMFPEAIWLIPDFTELSDSILTFLNALSAKDILVRKEAAERYSQEFVGMEYTNQMNLLKMIK